MRVAIIAANNIRYSPYINFYVDILESMNCEYEVIYALRENIQDRTTYKAIGLSWQSGSPKIMRRFIYYKNVKKICEREQYDFLIVLTTSSAVMLSSWLEHRYKDRYIVDIRDYTHENILPYFIMEKIAIENSAMNVISSSAFERFLPKGKYTICHNISVENNIQKKWVKTKKSVIKIGYIGSIGYENQCISLMNLVMRDERFKFDFFGTGPAEGSLRKYWESTKNPRICFNGGYLPEEKASIIESIDILFNAYGNDSDLLRCALSNKLYDAMYYGKLILVSPNTYMETLSGIIGYPIDFREAVALDNLYDWYISLDEEDVNKYMNRMMTQFLDENRNTVNRIRTCIERRCDACD